MAFLKKVSVTAIICGFIVVAVSGMSVRAGPDGTWVQVNVVHLVGSAVFLTGVMLALVVMAFGNRPNALRDLDSK